jgi:hypothetical protein
MNVKLNPGEAKAYVDELYRKVAKRWEERVTCSRFMRELNLGTLSKRAKAESWGTEASDGWCCRDFLKTALKCVRGTPWNIVP